MLLAELFVTPQEERKALQKLCFMGLYSFTILQAFPLYKAYMLGFGQVHEGS